MAPPQQQGSHTARLPQQIVEYEAHAAGASSGPQVLQTHQAIQRHELKRACVAAASARSDRKHRNDVHRNQSQDAAEAMGQQRW